MSLRGKDFRCEIDADLQRETAFARSGRRKQFAERKTPQAALRRSGRMNQLALNLPESRRRKRAGMALAASKNSEWIAETLPELRRFAADRIELTVESFRAYQKLRGAPQPTSPKVWGSLALQAVKAGILTWTGRYINAASVKTHAHPIRVYRAGSAV